MVAGSPKTHCLYVIFTAENARKKIIINADCEPKGSGSSLVAEKTRLIELTNYSDPWLGGLNYKLL
jgi:hypothetical protein